MSSLKDWIIDNEEVVWDKFKLKYQTDIKEEYNLKYKDSYPSYENFLEEEQSFITEIFDEKWFDMLNDEHISSVSSEMDMLMDREKDNQIEELK